MVTKTFKFIVLLSLISVGANISMDVFDLIFFRTGIIILFMASLLDKPKRQMPEYVNKIVFGLLGLCIFNLFITTFAPQVLAQTMNVFLSVIGVYVLYSYLDEKNSITKYILWAGAINLLFCIGQRFGFDPVFDKIPQNNVNLAGAFLGNNPRLGTFFAMIVPLFPFLFLPVGLLLVLLTDQFVILIPMAIIVFLRIKSLKFKVVFVAILILLCALLHKHVLFSIHTRAEVWLPVLTAFFDRPLIGWGLGTKILPDLDAYFNSYMSFIVDVGILGLVWFWYLFKNIYKKILDNRESVALITLMIIMFLEYPIEITRLWYLIIFIIVMFLIKDSTKTSTAL